LTVFEQPGRFRKLRFIDTGDPKKLTESRDNERGEKTFDVMRSPLNVLYEPQRFVTIKVVDQAGQPVRDGGVAMSGYAETFLDERGEACIPIRKPGPERFFYGADPLTPRLGTSVTADIAAGVDTPVIAMRLPEAKWLSGRVVDAETGQGIAGVYVSYAQP